MTFSKIFSQNIAIIFCIIFTQCRMPESSRVSSAEIENLTIQQTPLKAALQSDYSADVALFYYLTFNFSICEGAIDSPKCKIIKFHGWDVNNPKHNPTPQILVQLQVLDELKNTNKKVLIFTDSAKDLIDYWKLSSQNQLAQNFSIIQAETRGISNTVWARDYLGKVVYKDWPEAKDIHYVGTNVGTASEQALSKWLAEKTGIPYSWARTQLLAGGNILSVTSRSRIFCYLTQDSVVKQEFLKDVYGCDENILLEPTTPLRHVDLTLSIVPESPDNLNKFKFVMAEPKTTSRMWENFNKNRMIILNHIKENPQLFSELVLLPMDVYGEYLSPTNFTLIPEARKILLSNADGSSRNQDVVDIMTQTFPDWDIQAIDMTANWRGGIHCMTGQLATGMFDKITAQLGNDRMGAIKLVENGSIISYSDPELIEVE